MDKAAFSIIHVNRNKRETGLPFIAEPAASDDCLRDLFVSEKIHQDKKDKTPPAVICMEYDRDARREASCIQGVSQKYSSAQNARYPIKRVKKTFCLSA